MIKPEQMFEAICKSGSCCWGLSKVSSPEVISEAFSEFCDLSDFE